jgi:hypothetical protein
LNGEGTTSIVAVSWQLVCIATCSLDLENLVSWNKTKIKPEKMYLGPQMTYSSFGPTMHPISLLVGGRVGVGNSGGET